MRTHHCTINFITDERKKFKEAVRLGYPGPSAEKMKDLAAIRFAADRTDPSVKFTDDALMNFVKVPRPFLKTVLNGCVAWAKESECHHTQNIFTELQ